MSFGTYARKVRDDALPYRHRVGALRSCVQIYRPIGFNATLSFLDELAGPYQRNEAALLRALDALTASREQWKPRFADTPNGAGAQSCGFGWLREIAGEHVDELIGEFARETDHGLRCWLLELVGEARSPRAFDLLVAQLGGDDESLRWWAQRGLRLLDTKDARRVLWQHSSTGRPVQGP